MIKEEDFYDNNTTMYNYKTCKLKNCYTCLNNIK